MAMQKISNYIDGELIPPRLSRYLENLEPATGLAYSEAPDSDASDIDRAVDAAEKAFSAWAEAPLEERARLLRRLAELIKERAEAFAHAESVDSGKPLSAARQVDIPRAAANFEFFSSAIQHFFSESHATGTQALNYTLRAPLGVVGCISPWNLPLYLFTWKVAPALAAGNTVVAKPSELTPMTAYLLSEVCREAKLPPGVLNIIHGTGAKVGQSLVEHPKVQAISFTGGTDTGRPHRRDSGPALQEALPGVGWQESQHRLCRLRFRARCGDIGALVLLQSGRDLPVGVADIHRAADLRQIQRRIRAENPGAARGRSLG